MCENTELVDFQVTLYTFSITSVLFYLVHDSLFGCNIILFTFEIK